MMPVSYNHDDGALRGEGLGLGMESENKAGRIQPFTAGGGDNVMPDFPRPRRGRAGRADGACCREGQRRWRTKPGKCNHLLLLLLGEGGGGDNVMRVFSTVATKAC